MADSSRPAWFLTLPLDFPTLLMMMATSKHNLLAVAIYLLPFRYALHLVDTIKVEQDKAVLLTDGVKSIKDALFFLNSEEVKPAKKAPVKPLANGAGSPLKNK